MNNAKSIQRSHTKSASQRSHTKSASKSSLNNVSQGIGCMVAWAFNGKSWLPSDLRQWAGDIGMSWLKIKDVPVTNGMHNAAQNFRDVSTNEEPIKADKCHSDPDAGLYTFALLEREADSTAKRSKYDTIDKVTYDAGNQSFLSTGKTAHAQKLIDAINFRVSHYTGNEFRKWVIMPCLQRWKAMRIMGGSYYVTDKFQSEVNQLEELCTKAGVTLIVLDQRNTQRTTRNIGNETKKTILTRIEDCKKQLDTWKGRKRIRKDGSEKLLGELKDILDTSKMLQGCLSMKIDDIKDQIKDCTNEAIALINNQSTKPVTSKKVLNLWKNAMKPEYEVDEGIYMIPFEDIDKLCLPETAKQKHYYKAGQRLARALIELDMIGSIRGEYIILNSTK